MHHRTESPTKEDTSHKQRRSYENKCLSEGAIDHATTGSLAVHLFITFLLRNALGRGYARYTAIDYAPALQLCKAKVHSLQSSISNETKGKFSFAQNDVVMIAKLRA